MTDRELAQALLATVRQFQDGCQHCFGSGEEPGETDEDGHPLPCIECKDLRDQITRAETQLARKREPVPAEVPCDDYVPAGDACLVCLHQRSAHKKGTAFNR